MNRTRKAAVIAAVALASYDTLVCPRILDWGATSDEQHMQLPGDDIASPARRAGPAAGPQP